MIRAQGVGGSGVRGHTDDRRDGAPPACSPYVRLRHNVLQYRLGHSSSEARVSTQVIVFSDFV
jgi:hypothetical protein